MVVGKGGGEQQGENLMNRPNWKVLISPHGNSTDCHKNSNKRCRDGLHHLGLSQMGATTHYYYRPIV